ncbi:MAG: NUDIX hydrolase [Parvularculaceae bacterium]
MDASAQGKLITIGVGAVVLRGEDVLVIKRGKPPFLGQWSIPGGGLHYGEAIEDAVRREVREETGVEIRILGLIGVFEALPREAEGDGRRGHVVLVDYAAEWLSGEPIAGDDAADAAFVSVAEAISRLSWDKTRLAVARAIEIRDGAAKPL